MIAVCHEQTKHNTKHEAQINTVLAWQVKHHLHRIEVFIDLREPLHVKHCAMRDQVGKRSLSTGHCRSKSQGMTGGKHLLAGGGSLLGGLQALAWAN